MYSEKLTAWLFSGTEEANEAATLFAELETRIWDAGYDFDQINAKAGNPVGGELRTMEQVKVFAFHAANKVRGFK